jgi:hypothetical protein
LEARIKPDLASRSREGGGAATGTGTSTGTSKARKETRWEESAGVSESREGRRGSGTMGRGSPNESGTEADDESISYIRALPAPPLRPRKGLKMGFDGQETPLLTPTAIDEEGARFDFPMTTSTKSKKTGADKTATGEELCEARAKFVKRRRAELARRASEVLLLALIGMFILGNEVIRSSIQPWHRGQYTHLHHHHHHHIHETNQSHSRACQPHLHHLSAVPAVSNPPDSVRMEEDQVTETGAEDHTAPCCL